MGKSTKALLQKWDDRLAISKKWREQIMDRDKWEIYLDQYKGKYDVVLGNNYVPPINEVYAYVESTKANLFYKNPYIAVNAKTTGNIQGAYILEAALNYYWRELKIKKEVELEIMDCISIGHGWNKVGNNVKTTGDGDNLHLESEKLFSNRVSWRDMLMNIGCKEPPYDNLWMAQRIYRPTEDIKRDYGSRASQLVGGPHPDMDKKFKDTVSYKDDTEYSAIYEIWDARERKIYLKADSSLPDFLEDPKPWPDYLDEFPFQMLQFNKVPDEAYPMSDIAPWNPQVLEKIKIFTQMLNHIKRWNRQLIAKKGAMTSTEWDKFEKGIDGSILFSTVADVQTAFKLLDYGQLPPDIYMALDRIDQVITTVRGQSSFDQGGMGKTQTRTLGELQLQKGGSGARTDLKLGRIEEHCENIARHLMFHIKNQFDVSQMVKITGNEPQEIIQAFANQGMYDPASKTIKFDKSMITGEYDVTVKAGSTLPLDKGTRDSILDSVMQTSVQLASSPTLPPFVAEIIKERLRDYDIKGLEVAFDQQQQTVQQQQQSEQQSQQELDAKVQAETAKRQAQAKQISVDTVIKGATAMGKATGAIPLEAKV